MTPYRLFALFLVILPLFVFSQDYAEFKIRNEFEIRGDIAIIGNQIINRQTDEATAHTPYHNRSEKAKINDQFKMYYTDIDNDENTFSSSSADLTLPENSRIAYAGLYWSATYPYTLGKHKSADTFKVLDQRRISPENILLKLPSETSYIPVRGDILADNYTSENQSVKEKGGYLAYADITQMMKAQPFVNGTYLVANILAANGEIRGGACGGWFLVVVFERDSDSVKKIITQDGFIYGNTRIGYDFSGNENKNIRVLGAVLEGDLNIANDKIIGYLPKSNVSFTLKTDTRKENNFFNSSITKNNQYLSERNPNSLNTLGFDLYDIDLSQTITANDIESITFKIVSVSDKAFQLFNAISIEIGQTTDKKDITNENIPSQLPFEQPSNQSFYNVVGVFKNKHYATDFIISLTKKGVSAKYWFDEPQNLYYIYTKQSDLKPEALEQQTFLSEQKKIKNWILTK